MIADEITKVSYTGDGSTTSFPFSFPYDKVTDIYAVIHDDDTDEETKITSDYYIDTVANTYNYPGYASGQEPATAEQPAVLTSTQKIYIYRDTPETQLVDMGDKYPLTTIETTVDKLTMIAQEHAELLDRCIKANISSSLTIDATTIEEIYAGRDAAVAAAAAASVSQTDAAASKTAAAASATAAADSATAAATSAANAAASATTAGTKATQAATSASNAAVNATAAQASATTAASKAQDATDQAAMAATAASGAEAWAKLANDYTEPLRNALEKSMFEYDTNADLMPVANPLAAVSDLWTTDDNGDIEPAA